MVLRSNWQATDDVAGGGQAALSGEDNPVLLAVRAAKAGHEDGVRRFLMVIAPWVRRTCRGVLGAGHSDLDDTIQESLFAAVKALANYRFDGDIRNYVTKIALRIAIAAKGTNAARWRKQDLFKNEPPWDASAPVPEEWSTHEINLVRGIVDRLSGVQREAVLMRIVLGYSVEEIAVTTGVSQNTVKARVRRGKDALRKDLRKSPFWKRWLLERTS